MAPPKNSADRGSEADDRLDEIVAGYLDRMNAGEMLDRDEILREHPELAQEIVERLEVFQTVGIASEAQAVPLGTLGDYTLRRQIGRGGMGAVYEAWENSMGRRVALKVMPKAVALDSRAVARFVQEAQLAGRLSHPNIVHVHGMGVKEQIPYYAMDFVEGETLAQIVERLKDAEPGAETEFGKKDSVVYFGKLAEAFASVADGLQHAHSHKVIHRDIKPSNLILDRAGRLRILDFGLAKLEGQQSLTATGDFMGTVLYMSPEQAMAKRIQIDHRTDIYSFGAAFYEALTCRPPFEGHNSQDTLSQIIFRDPELLRRRNAGVPKDLETIVLKCLRKEPGERYGTAEALAQDLRRFTRNDPIEARAMGQWERTRRKLWRVRGRVAVGVVVTALVAALLLLVAKRNEEARLATEREYERLVRAAAASLELASLQQKTRSGELGSAAFMDERVEVGGSAADPMPPAIRDLKRAVELIPARPDARYHLSRALRLGGANEEADAALGALLQDVPHFVPGWLLKSSWHIWRGDPVGAAGALDSARNASRTVWDQAWIEAAEATSRKNRSGAAAAHSRLLEGPETFVGSSFLVRMARGEDLRKLGRFAEALRDFHVASYLVPDALGPLILEAKALRRMGRDEEAEELLERTFERSQKKDEVALQAAFTYGNTNQIAGSLKLLNRISIPSLRESERAWLQYFSGNFAESKTAARMALTHDPANVDAYVVLLYNYTGIEGRPDLALLAIEEGDRHRPGSYLLQHYRAWALLRLNRHREAIEARLKAAQLALNPGYDFAFIAWSYFALGDDARGDEWSRRALEADPAHPSLGLNLANPLDWAGRLEDAFEAARRNETHGWGMGNMARARFRQGRWTEAVELARRAQEMQPFFAQPFFWAAFAHLKLNDPNAAIEEIAHLCEVSLPLKGPLASLVPILDEFQGSLAAGSLERMRDALTRHQEALKDDSTFHHALAVVLASLSHAGSRARAVEETLRGLDAAQEGGEDPSDLGLLLRSIVVKCSAMGLCPLATLPSTPTYAGIDALFADGPNALAYNACDVPGDVVLTSGDPKTTEANRRQAYLRAKLLVAAGRHSEAIDAFDALCIVEKIRPEPLLSLASALRDSGRSEDAERVLRTALEAQPARDRRLWDAWLAVSFDHLHQTPGELLDRFPRVPATPAAPLPQEFLARLQALETRAPPEFAEDVRWMLEELAAGHPLRIACGGDGVTFPDGEVWSKDRFALGGTPILFGEVPIAGTERDAIYQKQRWFNPTVEIGSEPVTPSLHRGYRISLPAGRWTLRLHFVETENWPGLRRFDVVVQGKKVLADFEILAEAPFRTALIKEFEAVVETSPLEILFSMKAGPNVPVVSGIEVERKE